MSGFGYANCISNYAFRSPSPPASPPSSSSDEDDASPSPTNGKPYCYGCKYNCENQAAHFYGCQPDPRCEDFYSSDEETSIDNQRLSNPPCLACQQELTTDAQCLDAHTCDRRSPSLSPRPVKRSRSETQPLTSPEASPSESPDPPYYNTTAVYNEVKFNRDYSRDTTVAPGYPCDYCGAEITDINSFRCGPKNTCLIQDSQGKNY
jgi:hypothetical protein